MPTRRRGRSGRGGAKKGHAFFGNQYTKIAKYTRRSASRVRKGTRKSATAQLGLAFGKYVGGSAALAYGAHTALRKVIVPVAARSHGHGGYSKTGIAVGADTAIASGYAAGKLIKSSDKNMDRFWNIGITKWKKKRRRRR